MAEQKVPDFPEADASDADYNVARTAASAVPIAGPALVQLMDSWIGAPLEHRRRKWFMDLAERLAKLSQRLDGFDPSVLGESEEFLSAVYAATDTALKTTSEEKREALRNAVLNVAAGIDLEESIRDKFFGLLVQLTPVHLRMLKILQNPATDPVVNELAASASDTYNMLALAIPELGKNDNLVKQLYRDLNNPGLIEEAIVAMGTRNFAFDPRTTEMGNAFLKFIVEPDAELVIGQPAT